MTPEDFSERHPRLYHVTLAGSTKSIRANGLLSTRKLLDWLEVRGKEREQIERKPRPEAVRIDHQAHGTVIINDQFPLNEQKLSSCLDDGLSTPEWLAILNCRIFFWADEKRAAGLLGARANRKRALELIVVDTLPLARVYANKIELSPINSGSTLYNPARRGHSTFTPLLAFSHQEWSKRRGKSDTIAEVTILEGVPDIDKYIIEVKCIPASEH